MIVRIILEARTKSEYVVLKEVPDTMCAADLDEMVQAHWDGANSINFIEDTECWEQGHCRWEKVYEKPMIKPVMGVDWSADALHDQIKELREELHRAQAVARALAYNISEHKNTDADILREALLYTVVPAKPEGE